MGLLHLPKLFTFVNVNGKRFLTSKVMFDIKTFVFLDSETTGLPFMEHNQTRITELCLVAVQAGHIELGVFPRVLNKLNFCFNPSKMILPECTQLTGLSNDMLEHQSKFSLKTVNTIVNFLESSRTPICLVAHNGNRFDYPILKAEINRVQGCVPDDILCIDSLETFRFLDNPPQSEQKQNVVEENTKVPFEFNDNYDEILCQIADEMEGCATPKKLSVEEIQKANETTPTKSMVPPGYCPAKQNNISKKNEKTSAKKTLKFGIGHKSFKLVDIYRRLICKEPSNEHEAESDVKMLITCAATFGEEFINYANNNAKYFRDIPMMVPGKKIGS